MQFYLLITLAGLVISAPTSWYKPSSKSPMRIRSNIPKQTPTKPVKPPEVQSISATVTAKGPGVISTNTFNSQRTEVVVPAGESHTLQIHDKHGASAKGVMGRGGSATVAATGNGVAAMTHLKGGKGYIKTYDDAQELHTEVRSQSPYLKMVDGDNTGRIKATTIASIEGPGHVIAVAVDKQGRRFSNFND